MKPFQFALDVLLRLRVQNEERLARELADQQRRVEEQKRSLAHLNQSRQETEDRLRGMVREGCIDLVMEQACHAYLQRVGAAIRQAQSQLEALTEAMKRQQQELIRAHREVKVLEKLKERRLAEHLKAARREGQKIMDEVGSHQRQIRNPA